MGLRDLLNVKTIVAIVATAVIAGATGGFGAGPAGAWAFSSTAFYSALAVQAAFVVLGKAAANRNDSNWATGTFDASGRNLTVRSPISPWQIVLGRCRVGGVLAFAHISADKQYFHMVILLAAHASDAIESVYLNDQVINIADLDASGNVQSGQYSRTDSTARVFVGVVSGGYVVMDYIVSTIELVMAHDPNAAEGAQADFVVPSVTYSGSTVFVDAAYEGMTLTVNYHSSAVVPLARIKYSLGGEAYGTQPFPDLVAESGGAWSTTDCWDGHTKLYIRFDKSAVQSGFPQVSAVVRGKKLYDSRSGTTVYKNNAALAVADYFTDTEYGLGAEFADELHQATLEDAADVCDEAVSLAAGGTESRYTVNGTYRTSERPGEILEKLLGAMAGRAVHASDRWYIYAGAYSAPTVTLTDDELAGGVTINPLPDRENWCNVVRGVFMNPATWQADDFPPIVSDTYIADDGGEEIAANLDFSSFVASATQAQRLAKIHLFRSRNAMTHEANWRLSAYRALTGCNVAVDSDRYGWSGQVFQLASSQFVVTQGEGGAPALGVRHTLVQDASEFYDWSTSEEGTLATAATTNLPNPASAPAAPGEPRNITEELYETTGSAGVKVRVSMSWTGSVGPYVRNHVLEYKRVDEAGYHQLTVNGTERVLDDLASGVYYLFRTLAIGENGRESTRSATVAYRVRGLSDAPDPLVDFNITPRAAGYADLSWARHGDLDVRIGGRIVIRYSPATSGAGWNDMVQIAWATGDAQAVNGVPLMSGTYAAKAIDSSGNESSLVSIVTTEPDLLGYNAITTITGETAWTGTKVNVVERSGKLQLGCVTVIDDMTDPIDSWPLIDAWGGIASEGYITFDSNIIDLGASYTNRVSADIETLSLDNGTPIDEWQEPIDNWGLIDGAEISDTTAEILIATTQTDPNASPVWSDWQPFVIGEYKARGLKFRVRLRSGNTEHNIQVEHLTISIDMPDRRQTITGTSSAVGDTAITWTISPAFKITPKPFVTVKNMATGDFFQITGESTTGFTFNVKNSAGTRVARDYVITGDGY